MPVGSGDAPSDPPFVARMRLKIAWSACRNVDPRGDCVGLELRWERYGERAEGDGSNP